MYLSRRVLVPLGLAVLVLIVALGALFYKTASPAPIQVIVPNDAPVSADLKVYVSGAVREPGVYLLGASDRVEDAMRAAGGPLEGADLNRINLAARLRDGDHVLVPRAGEIVPANTAGAPRLNINTATQKELEELPGVGTVRARQVIESRAAAGAFLDPLELVSRHILTLAVYERLKDLIAVN